MLRPGAVVKAKPVGAAARRRHSIRASLIALVAACLAPALLVSGYLVYDNYAQHRARLERDAVLQARSLAAALDREFSGVVSGLRVLSTSPALAAGDLRAFHERAREALAFQIVDNYVMTDRQGEQHINTLRDFDTPLPRIAAAAYLVGIGFAVRLSARVGRSIRGLVEPALSLGLGRPMEHIAPTHLEEVETVAQAMGCAGSGVVVEGSTAVIRSGGCFERL